MHRVHNGNTRLYILLRRATSFSAKSRMCWPSAVAATHSSGTPASVASAPMQAPATLARLEVQPPTTMVVSTTDLKSAPVLMQCSGRIMDCGKAQLLPEKTDEEPSGMHLRAPSSADKPLNSSPKVAR